MAWGRNRDSTHAHPIRDRELINRVRPGERLLAAAMITGGAEAVGGTDRALYLPGGVVLGWNEIDQASWQQDEFRLDLVTLPIDGPARSYTVPLAEPGRLPELVRERVTSSIVVNQHVALIGRRGVKIIARRIPGSDDLEWVVVYDDGVDPATAEVEQGVRRAVAVLRRDLGV